MHCIWYWPMTEINGRENGGSIEGGISRVNVVVEGGDGEIGHGWGF